MNVVDGYRLAGTWNPGNIGKDRIPGALDKEAENVIKTTTGIFRIFFRSKAIAKTQGVGIGKQKVMV